MKTFVNSVFQVYPPVIPTKICNTNEEGMEFIVNVIKKKRKERMISSFLSYEEEMRREDKISFFLFEKIRKEKKNKIDK